MANYLAPSKEINFVLNKVLDYEKLNALTAFSEATPELTEVILDNAAKFAGEVLSPINRSGDCEGVKVKGSEVKLARQEPTTSSNLKKCLVVSHG